jgi:hypothetical protein
MNAPLNLATVEQAGNKELLLASMRCAVANLRSWQLEIETCGLSLKTGAITIDDAVAWMDELGVLVWLPAPEPGPRQ